MITVLSDYFVTDIGTIRTWVESNIDNTIDGQGELCVVTDGYLITLEKFEIKNDWSPGEMSLQSSCGWRWFIEKLTSSKERLTINCQVLNPSKNINCEHIPGENFDTIRIESNIHQLYIGTEDGGKIQTRARASDWMPNRLQDEITADNSFTTYVDFGFRTTLPDLQEDERAYFHFLVAISQKDERNNLTWRAVNQNKSFLDEHLGGNIS